MFLIKLYDIIHNCRKFNFCYWSFGVCSPYFLSFSSSNCRLQLLPNSDGPSDAQLIKKKLGNFSYFLNIFVFIISSPVIPYFRNIKLSCITNFIIKLQLPPDSSFHNYGKKSTPILFSYWNILFLAAVSRIWYIRTKHTP